MGGGGGRGAVSPQRAVGAPGCPSAEFRPSDAGPRWEVGQPSEAGRPTDEGLPTDEGRPSAAGHP